MISMEDDVRILSCAQEEMTIQEDSLKVGEDDGLKKKKISRSRYVSQLTID